MSSTPTPVNHHAQARAAGLSPVRAARWVSYVAMKRAKGETPISLDEAVRQVAAAVNPMQDPTAGGTR